MRAKFTVADESNRKFKCFTNPMSSGRFDAISERFFRAIFRAIPGCTRGLSGAKSPAFSIYMLLSRTCV